VNSRLGGGDGFGLTFEAGGSKVTVGVRRHQWYSTEFKLQLATGIGG